MAYTYHVRFGAGLTGVLRPAATPPVAPDDVVEAPLSVLLLTPGCSVEIGGYELDGTERPDDTLADAALTVELWADDDE